MSVATPQEIPLSDVEPNQIYCPFCGKPFKTRTEMERHKVEVHDETKGHE